MSYLRYLCLFVHSGVKHILCCVFVLSCVPYVASFSCLSIFDCPFVIRFAMTNYVKIMVSVNTGYHCLHCTTMHIFTIFSLKETIFVLID